MPFDSKRLRGMNPSERRTAQVNQRRHRHARRADRHCGAGDGIQHPGRNHRNHAGCRLEIDIAAGEALLAAVLPDTTPIQRMPTIVDLDLWPDMGRMAG
jgi:hypothetical protein